MNVSTLSKLRREVAFGFIAGIAICTVARADVRCPPVFGDHMVLQRNQVVPVWGEAAPGESVSVDFAGQTKTTTADPSGHWRVDLAALESDAHGRTLAVRGANNTLSFTDVVVGEVWFCSGQSNMEKPLGPRKGQKPTDGYEAELGRANLPLLRLFQEPLSGNPKGKTAVLHWLPCDGPALVATDFSAAAYYFGRRLVQAFNVPVGVIHSSFGGTRIEAWMPPEAFASDPAVRDREHLTYSAWVSGVQPTELYASQVAPFVPYAIRGFLWYQGETNCMDAEGMEYAAMMKAMIHSWREAWREPDAPFYYALIAPFAYSAQTNWEKQLTAEELPIFWEAQVAALAVPHTGIITTTDIVANVHDIHPTDKRDVGERFADLALEDTYGWRDVDAYTPRFEKIKKRDAAIELVFAHGSGLRSRDGKPLNEFTIAGADKNFVPAVAIIEQNGVVLVSSPSVADPVAVRFAWQETADPNLVNAAGLPALPFRTDDWPVEREVPKANGRGREEVRNP